MTAHPEADAAPIYPVLIRRGDASAEVDRAVRELGGDAAAGLHRTLYVVRADQTVVMVTHRDAPLAKHLRQAGWSEPRDPEPQS